MTRVLWMGVCVLAVGCGSTGGKYTPPPEQLPPPIDVGGATVVIDDQRPDWERQPFTGSVTLYHLGRVKPSPWEQLAKQTETIVAAMPQKPQRVTVTVVSYRLVRRDDKATRDAQEAHRKEATANNLTGQNPDPSVNYKYGQSPLGNQQTASTALGQLGSNPLRQSTGWAMGFVKPRGGYNDTLFEHPPGASCELTAVVELLDHDGQTRTVNVKCMGSGLNTSGTAYWGEALEYAVNLAVANFGRQFREGVGLPAE